MPTLEEEISRRRTFAIISHPDAGKTTLTEKFLLYGGAIAQAGEVKGKRAKAATSDWMEIEKQRGISVTSSVMQFQHNGFCINILDTPGHQDFSEDTYRTMTALRAWSPRPGSCSRFAPCGTSLFLPLSTRWTVRPVTPWSCARR